MLEQESLRRQLSGGAKKPWAYPDNIRGDKKAMAEYRKTHTKAGKKRKSKGKKGKKVRK